MENSKIIICLGIILIDMFPNRVGCKLADVTAFLPKPGGAPANVAVALARRGIGSAFVGKVGADAFGDLLENTLKEQGVFTGAMCRDEQARTTLAFIARPDEHTAEFVFYRNPGADMRLCPEDLDEELFARCSAFHFDSLSLTDEPAHAATIRALELARKAGGLISFDVNYRPTLWRDPAEALAQIEAMIARVDLLKINEVELKLLTGSDDPELAAPDLLKHGPRLVVVTLGARGSWYFIPGGCGFVPAFAVDTVDATGCGDAFISGVLGQLVNTPGGWQSALHSSVLEAYLKYSSAVGALTAQTVGVIPALPTADQVNQFIKSKA